MDRVPVYWVARSGDNGAIGTPWPLEDLTTHRLAEVLADLVHELERRGAWVGPRPRTRLEPAAWTESELRASWGDR